MGNPIGNFLGIEKFCSNLILQDTMYYFHYTYYYYIYLLTHMGILEDIFLQKIGFTSYDFSGFFWVNVAKKS